MNEESMNEFDIAIVGMSGRFPGAENIDAYWHSLVQGEESVRFFTDDELAASGISRDTISDPRYVKAAPVLDGPSLFDASFFGYSPRDAALLDPQQRIFLECCWSALENAGHTTDGFDGRIGVYAGSAMNTYFLYAGLSGRFAAEYLPTLIASDKDFLSTRVSYKMNLTGPSLTIQTACSTSLVAIHVACQSLLNQECDMAMAGGVAVRVPHIAGHLAEEGSVFTPDGHCRPFDRRANGTIFGSGAGVVVLKRAADAIADRDHIWAIIKGSAVNNDGAGKSDYTAPSVKAQSAAVVEALASAGVDADSITYVEAHGTGTYLGDPIELRALTKAFRSQTEEAGFCRIGSVKSNIGHLDAAAGVAGLIKTVLALKNKRIPATLNFQEPNPEIDFEGSPFVVNDRLIDWETERLPRRAAINSLGIGGTNAHMILEEAPECGRSPASDQSQLLMLSAKSEASLDAGVEQLCSWLGRESSMNLADAAYTLAVGRESFSYRHFAVVNDYADAIGAIKMPRQQSERHAVVADPDVVFMFPGQGAQHPQMGRQLYEQEPVFAEELDRCAEQLRREAEFDLLELLYSTSPQEHNAESRLQQTSVTQPAIFAIELSLARLWQSWGIEPTAMVGHSVGEYVAACLADVLSAEDALRLVTRRGHLMQELPSGQMLAVTLPADRVEESLPDGLAIAAVNSPEVCVVSGTSDSVSKFAKQLESSGVVCQTLRTSHAFHSPMMEPMLDRFRRELDDVVLRPARRMIYSTVTGGLANPDCFTCHDHWIANIRNAVQFSDCALTMLARHRGVYIEVGPGTTLGSLLQQHNSSIGKDDRLPTILSSLPHPRDATPARQHLLKSLGRAWQAGVSPDWTKFYSPAQRQRLPMPSYQFDRKSHWLTPEANPVRHLSSPPDETQSSWLYQPSWIATPIAKSGHFRPGPWLLFGDGDSRGVAMQLRDQLVSAGHEVTLVIPAEEFSSLDNKTYSLCPDNAQHYDSLFRKLSKAGQLPANILHCFGLASDLTSDGSRDAQSLGLHSLIALAQAIGRNCPTQLIGLCVASSGVHAVAELETTRPEMATILGPCKLIPIELPQVLCWNVDFALNDLTVTEQLASEMRGASSSHPVVAYRNGVRLTEEIDPVTVTEGASIFERLRDDATYLIIGGLGGLGVALTSEIARHVRANFILIGRSELASRDRWDDLTSSDERAKIQGILDIESTGSKCVYRRADVTDREQVAGVLEMVKARFGKLDGVIHAAGMMDTAGPMQTRSTDDTDRVVEAKLHGVQILDELLADEPLDWMVLCSSNTTTLYQHRIGEVAYVAANSFLDAYAYDARRRYPDRLTQTINWDAWQGIGMSAAALERAAGAFVKNTVFQEDDVLTAADGAKVFARAMRSGTPRVIVSKRDIRKRLAAERSKESVAPMLQTRRSSGRGDCVQQLTGIWQDLLGVSAGPDDDFIALGGSSLTAIQMNSRIEATLGKRLPLASILEARTINNLTKLIEGDAPQRNTVSLVDLQPLGDRPPLFLMHAAGGNLMFYRQLVDRLGKNQPVFGFQSQGLQDGRPLATSIAQMAELYTRELRQVAPHGPYLLGGYCMGGTIAYEVAQQLRAMGEEVALLAMFETYNWARIKQVGAISRSRFLLEKTLFLWRNLWNLPLAERRVFWDEKVSVIRDRSTVWRGAWSKKLRDSQDSRLLSELWRINDLAALEYQPKPYDGVIDHFRPRAHHSSYRCCEFEATEVRFHELDCFPAAMLLRPHADRLAARLNAAIDRATQ